MKKEIISGVYIIINKINNKIYIGSSININSRFYAHKKNIDYNKHHSIKLQRAWRKYGEQNFEFKIIEQIYFQSSDNLKTKKKTLEDKEQYYLNKLLFANENNNKFHNLGYNILRIAGSNLGAKVSNRTKQKHRENNIKRWNDKSYRIKMSKALKGVNKGNIREDLKKYNIKAKSKIVLQYDFDGNLINEWSSLNEIERKLNFNRGNISKACLKKTKRSHGFIWRYKSDMNDNYKKINIANIFHAKRKTILQYDLNLNFIKEWSCILEAAKQLKLQHPHISNVCNNKRKTTGGFIWKFKNS